MTRRPTNPRTPAALWLVGAVVFFAAEAIAAAAVTPPYEYSYARDYISQLCVPGWTGLAWVMNAGLCVQGVLFIAGAVLAVRASGTGRRYLFAFLSVLYGLGVVLVGSVPIGPNAPEINLTVFHATGAMLAIFAGNAAVIAGAFVVAGLVNVPWYRTVSVTFGVLGFVSYVILCQPGAQPTLGVWERGSVYSTMLWQLFSGVILLARARSKSGAASRG